MASVKGEMKKRCLGVKEIEGGVGGGGVNAWMNVDKAGTSVW